MSEKLDYIELQKYWLKPFKEESKPHYTECQKRLICWSIAWEGSLVIQKTKTSFIPKITISNTDFELLGNFARIIKLGIIRLSTLKKRKTKWKPLKVLNIHNVYEVDFILEQLKGYMPCSRYRKLRSLISEFCKSRIKEHSKSKHEAPYSERDLEIIREVRKLNKRGL